MNIYKKGVLTRLIVWEVLQAVSAGAYVDKALARAFKKYSLSSLDKGLVVEISCGVIRRSYWLDCWIDFLGKIPLSKQPPLLKLLLQLGLYQIFCMDKIPPNAAVNTSVELIKASKLRNLTPVVNGLLRSALRAKKAGESFPLPSDETEKLAKEESLPSWIAGKLIKWHGVDRAKSIAMAFNRVPSLDIRINTLRTSRKVVFNNFKMSGFNVKYIDGAPWGLEVTDSIGDLTNWPNFGLGYWSVQDRAAQWITTLLDPQPGEIILDACAAPGGKTTHIAELIENQGEVWAVDRSEDRLRLLEDNACRLGTSCIKTLVADSTCLLSIKPNWCGYFDCILLDAPCSGLGTLSRHADARWRITPIQISELVDLQASLLKSLLPLLKVGGRILYSTCTIEPTENSIQIHKLLENNSELDLVFEEQKLPGINHSGDGFYAAILNYCRK